MAEKPEGRGQGRFAVRGAEAEQNARLDALEARVDALEAEEQAPEAE